MKVKKLFVQAKITTHNNSHSISRKNLFILMREGVFVEKLEIQGGNKLKGEIFIHGAKNSILPILSATIGCSGECVIHNCPKLSDVNVTIKILKYLGASVKREGHTLIVNTSGITKSDIPDYLMREMRSSIVFLGAIVSRFGKATLSFPGGCELGPRPIDLHLKALEQMGLIIEEYHGVLDCRVNGKLKGAQVVLSFPSVGATENIMIAASLAEGRTVITNAAREPEICDLADFLTKCGAKIKGAGEGTVTIDGVKKLVPADHVVIPDRIAAATFMAAVASSKGNLLLKNVIPSHLNAIIPIFEEAGCKVDCFNNSISIVSNDRLNSIKIIRTMPYPGFPTDAQAPIMAMSSLSTGTSVFVENIFESRYKHVGELSRMGANIKVDSRVAVVEGVNSLSGTSVKAGDLRGGAALIVAGLAAEGVTEINDVYHIDRGYESIEETLSSIGAKIKRI